MKPWNVSKMILLVKTYTKKQHCFSQEKKQKPQHCPNLSPKYANRSLQGVHISGSYLPW